MTIMSHVALFNQHPTHALIIKMRLTSTPTKATGEYINKKFISIARDELVVS